MDFFEDEYEHLHLNREAADKPKPHAQLTWADYAAVAVVVLFALYGVLHYLEIF